MPTDTPITSASPQPDFTPMTEPVTATEVPTATVVPSTVTPTPVPSATPVTQPVTPITQPVTPVQPPVNPVKPKANGAKPLMIVGCLLFLCVFAVLAGLGVYRFVYLPNAARDFVNNSETTYKAVKVQVKDVLAQAKDFGKKTGSSSNSDAIERLEKAKAQGQSLREASVKAKQTVPNSSPAVGDLREDLVAYYDIATDIGESYSVLTGSMSELVPVVQSTLEAFQNTSTLTIDSVEAIRETIKDYDNKASGLEQQQKKLPTVDAQKHPEIDKVLKSYNGLLSATIKFFRDSSKALNNILQAGVAGSQAKILEAQLQFDKDKTEFNTAMSNFSADTAELDDIIIEAYDNRSKASDAKAAEVDADYANIRKEYGL